MFRKISILCLIATAILITNAYSVSAQTAELRGRITTKDASGKEVPVPEAQVDVFRTDLPGEYKTKANKQGNFVFAGLPFIGQYIVSISAPGMQPQARGGIRADGQDKTFTLFPGDGKRFTKDEAKQSAAGNAPTPNGGQETAEQKKAREEIEKQRAEITEKNKKAEESNTIVKKSLEDGNAAFNQKNFPEAITQYTNGINADPAHPGAPVLLTNRALALVSRGVERYNNFVRNKDESSKTSAFEDFTQARQDSSKALELLKSATPPSDATASENHKRSVNLALSARSESMFFFVTKIDQSKAEEGYVAFQEYVAVEVDPIKKAKIQMRMSNMLLEAGVADKALAEFKKIIEVEPENYAAYKGAGIALFQTAAKENFQEAANYLQLFVDKAPDSTEKAEVKEILDYLKTEGVKAQKITPPSKTTKKKGN